MVFTACIGKHMSTAINAMTECNVIAFSFMIVEVYLVSIICLLSIRVPSATRA